MTDEPGVEAIPVAQIEHLYDRIDSGAVSKDGTIAVTASHGQVFVWDVVHGVQVRHDTGTSFALSSDGRTLLLADQSVRMCALATGRCTALGVRVGNDFLGLGFTSSGQHAFVYSRDSSYIISVADPTRTKRIKGRVVAVVDQPDGAWTTFQVESSVLYSRRWSSFQQDHANRDVVGWVPIKDDESHRQGFDLSAVSADGTQVLLGGQEGAFVIDTSGARPGRWLASMPVSAMTFDGRRPTLDLYWSRTIAAYDEQGRVVSRSVEGEGEVTTLAMSGTSRLLSDGKVVTAGSTRQLNLVRVTPAVTATSSPDGDQLVLQLGTRLWRWDLNDPHSAVAIESSELSPVETNQAVRFLGNQALVIAAADTKLWDLSADIVSSFPDPEASVRAPTLAVSLDHTAVFRSGGAHGHVGAVWKRSSSHAVLLVIPDLSEAAPAEEVVNASFSPSGAFLITGSTSGVARVWDTTTGAQLARFAHPRQLAHVAVGDDGFAVTADNGGKYDMPPPWARLWSWSPKAFARHPLEKLLGETLHAVDGRADRLLVDGWVMDMHGQKLWSVPVEDMRLTALSDDGTRAAVVADGEAAIRLFSAGRQVASIPVVGAVLVDLAFQGDQLLRGIDNEGIVHLWYACAGAPECRNASATELVQIVAVGTDWIAIDGLGHYDTSNFDALGGLAWVLSNRELTALPADLFIRDYYVPGLVYRAVAAVRNPEHAMPGLPPSDLAHIDSRVPRVAIERVVPAPHDAARAIVTVDVSGETGEAYDLRLFRDGNLAFESPGLQSGATVDLARWQTDMRIALGPDGHRRIQIEIPLASNGSAVELTAYAFNVQRLKGPTAHFTYEHAPRGVVVKARAVIVAIGVGPSGPGLVSLDWAPPDALTVARVFSEQLADRYRVIQIPMVSASERFRSPEHSCLRRSHAMRPDRANLHAVLAALVGDRAGGHTEPVEVDLPCDAPETPKTLPSALDPDDVLIVYISAHGTNAGGAFAFIGEGGERIPASDLASWMHGLQSDHIAVILDTCNSEAAIAAAGFRPGPLGDFTFGQLAYDKAMQILAASNLDAIDSPTANGSLLVHAIRDRIGEGRVTMGELLRYTVDTVPRLSRQNQIAGQRQQPALFDYRKGRDEIILGR